MTDESPITTADWARGSLKSKTMWFGTALAVLSTAAQLQPAWEPLFGKYGPLVGQAVGLGIMALRVVTRAPLPMK